MMLLIFKLLQEREVHKHTPQSNVVTTSGQSVLCPLHRGPLLQKRDPSLSSVSLSGPHQNSLEGSLKWNALWQIKACTIWICAVQIWKSTCFKYFPQSVYVLWSLRTLSLVISNKLRSPDNDDRRHNSHWGQKPIYINQRQGYLWLSSFLTKG